MVAQGAHASNAIILAHRDDIRVHQWLKGSFTKICVRVESEYELTEVMAKAEMANVLYAPIVDNGKTEFGGVPTLTCCAIGPDTDEILDPITGALKLL